MNQSLYPEFGVLLVDDETSYLRSLSILLERSGGITHIHRCDDSRRVMDILQQQSIGLVLLDLTMPHLSGKQLLTMITEQHPDIAVIIISGLNQVESAVECLQQGAFDYFVKTSEESRLIEGIKRAIRMQEMRRENLALGQRILNNSLERPEVFEPIVSRSPTMRAVFQYLESIAPSNQPLLICGESGTGKELLAQAAHQLSNRKGPLVTVNVAGLDDNVFADTLFGHQRGAFTGAERSRAGLVEQAANGTLFLDEIGDLSMASQVKLLRLLQEGEYYPLGSDRPKRIRARVIVATHQDLPARQADGSFRKDLYYRLCTHQIQIPPLRQRKEDIPLLLDHFIRQAAAEMDKSAPGYPPELPLLLSTYHFPGNIRELRALVYDAISRHRSHLLSMEVFRQAIGNDSDELPQAESTPVAFNPELPLPTLAQMDALLVEEALQRADHNQSLAARLLGISQPALSKRLKKMRPVGN
ncbi:sigma-54-dependent transcriptional regulator [Marinobacterium arenosum]|uniref:sigma-54-dependent transcriptional regulator n=1 Tax=Marinobacterium arenosum TaxID=2862496 RepID=UPI001C9583DB|nr:sigma-54 dependent transcriptional regulator [Marinobacterium arenosum]MBY4675714.1 sigma-54 dependent transcriptional regulator [Marinobacterium arenosum]